MNISKENKNETLKHWNIEIETFTSELEPLLAPTGAQDVKMSCVRACVTLFKRALKMSSRELNKQVSKQAGKQAGKQ